MGKRPQRAPSARGRRQTRSAARVRPRPGVDPVDVFVGMALIALIPFVVYLFALLFGMGAETTAAKPEVPPAPVDREEVEGRWDIVRDLYQVNAKSFADQMALTDDDAIREQFRQAARDCLRQSKQQADELVFLIKRYPATAAQFAAHLQQVAALTPRLETELDRLHELDVLNLDRRDG